jgi:peptidoglycan/xylan/chitin deacetylase (PgdA/CDA1 family)
MVSLAEAQQRMRSGENHRPSVSITFDDGYADNCRFALPLLECEKIPCTYFVASQHVLSGEPFPHDVALGRLARPNTRAEIRALANAGVEIGAHTRTHADLGLVWDADQLYEELVTSRSELQELTGWPVRYFAFPYGQHANLSQAAYRMAQDEGFAGVCSAYGGYNFPGDDPFHLQRIHADDDLLRLKNWVTFDPRKAARTRRFVFDTVAGQSRPAGTLAPADTAGATVS